MMMQRNSLPLRCWAEIDLAALEGNIRKIRKVLPDPVKYVAVVKADAYGHGVHQTVARLMHSGVDLFAVANIHEAAQIREMGSGWPILLLSALLPEEDEYALELQVTPTISSVEEAHRLADRARSQNRTWGFHLKIDTGMGRLGVWHEEVINLWQVIKETPELRLEGVYTHFSSADSDPDFTKRQRELFLAAIKALGVHEDPSVLIHADNSAGLESFSHKSPFNAVRVGLLQFGILPYPNSLLARVEPRPTFRFITRVSLVKTLPPETPVSYGQSFRTRDKTKVAILSAGYGDGLPRAMGNRGAVLIGGERCPIIGNVTMDQTMVDVTHLDSVTAGDEVVLIGRQGKGRIEIEEFSEWAKTIPWEVLTSVTKRVARLYQTPLGI
ncbi:MAG: alanine racemase [Opitutales bacterium]|nr:alanine racemase [Opitutales bacterium]